MSLIVSLIIMSALAVALRNPLRHCPALFYVLAAAICIAGLYLTLAPNPNPFLRSLAFALQKGQIGVSLFAVVMFIGVFDSDTAVRRYFNPVRAQLSIMAAILIVGHLTLYLRNYLFLTASLLPLDLNILISLVLALVLIVLLAVLTATSVNVVKRRLKSSTWKALQKLAYLFFGLVYFHMLGYLLPAALSGSTTALINVVVYSGLFVSYAALRSKKALHDKKAPEAVDTR